jgi:hypothetical protein
MTRKNDNLMRELQGLDPVRPGELENAADSGDATALLARIVSVDPESPGSAPLLDDRPERAQRGRRRRLRLPKLALGGVAAVAVAAVLLLVIGLPGGGGGSGGGSDRLAGTLDSAAQAAASQPGAGAERPYTYLKTQEVSVNTTDVDQRSWRTYQSTTREEWVTRDGSGRLRVVAGPSRFVGSGDRAEWEGAGRPNFLLLGFGKRTERRWLAAGMLRGGVEKLPTEPAALAARLREEAEAGHGELPVPAATLGLIAEDLRNPVASPRLRRALFQAAKLVPGMRYLGKETDPGGRSGIAVGITIARPGGPTVYSMILDPRSAEVLATEMTSPATTGSADGEAPTLLRATVYLESRRIGSLPEDEGTSLSRFKPAPPSGQPTTTDLVYRVPADTGPR